MNPGLSAASVVHSSQATRARRRGQPSIADHQPAAHPLISPLGRVQASAVTSHQMTHQHAHGQGHSNASRSPESRRPRLNRLSALIAAAYGLVIAGPALANTYDYDYHPPGYGLDFPKDPKYNYTSLSIGSKPGLIQFSGQYLVDYRVGGWRQWQDVSVGSASLTSPIDIEINRVHFAWMLDTPLMMRLGSSLDMKQVNLGLSGINLVFGAPLSGDSSLSLSNSRLLLNPGTPLKYDGAGSFTINALSGDNSIERGPKTWIDKPATINVSPGASLAFRDFLGLERDNPSSNLRFSGPNTTFNIDNGRLLIERTRLFADEGVMKLTNGSELVTTGSEWSGVHLKNLIIEKGSRLTMDHITEVTAKSLFLSNATVTLSGQASLSADSTVVGYSTEITGPAQTLPGTNRSYLNLPSVLVASDGGLKITSVSDVNVNELNIGARATVQLNAGTNMFAKKVELGGGRLDIAEGAWLLTYKDNGTNANFYGGVAGYRTGSELTLAPRSTLTIKPGTQLIVDDKLILTNRSQVDIEGRLIADGSILGDGVMLIKSGAMLLPASGSNPTGYSSVHFDNALALQKDAQVLLKLDPGGTGSGALPSRPVITYGPRPVIFYGAPTIELRGSGSLNANDLVGKSITVIAAQASGVAGTIDTKGFTPTIKPVNMPALLGYTLRDTNTNGKPDVTLFMDKPLSADPQRNSSLTSSNRQSLVNQMIAAANSNPAATASVSSITNEQLDQLHAEPYSSFITVNLEAIANTRNAIFARAMNIDPTGKRVWMDASESHGSINGQNGLGNFGYVLSNLTLGKDFGRAWGGAWGGYFAYGRNRMTEADIANQQLSGETHSVGVYGQWQHGAWESRMLLGYGRGAHDSRRFLSLTDFTGALQAQYNSNSLQAGFRSSYDWYNQKGVELRPEVGGSITTYRQSGFSESGNALYGLKVGAATAATYIAHVGLNARLPRLVPNVPVRPVAFGRVEYDFASSREHAVTAAMQSNPSNALSFTGQGRGPTTATIGIGLASDDTKALQLAGGVAFARHTYGSEWGAGLRLRYTW
ncbi:MAG: autotransporter domain-containing protein [Betaproteobacteria bacterium]|nr:autotransporter domain-containing protein [Betaproteobacteria bacterium]